MKAAEFTTKRRANAAMSESEYAKLKIQAIPRKKEPRTIFVPGPAALIRPFCLVVTAPDIQVAPGAP